MRPETREGLTKICERAGRVFGELAGELLSLVTAELEGSSTAAPAGEAYKSVTLPDVGPPAAEVLLTVEEAAEFLRVKLKTLYGWKAQGKIPFLQAGSRILFRRGDLILWLESRGQEAARGERGRPRRAQLRMVQ